MARKLLGRVRYDSDKDEFVYEIRTDDDNEEHSTDWGVSAAVKCYRREGAEEGEDTNFIHYDFVKTIVRDVELHGVAVHLA